MFFLLLDKTGRRNERVHPRYQDKNYPKLNGRKIIKVYTFTELILTIDKLFKMLTNF